VHHGTFEGNLYLENEFVRVLGNDCRGHNYLRVKMKNKGTL
jgi:hypothetical protein